MSYSPLSLWCFSSRYSFSLCFFSPGGRLSAFLRFHMPCLIAVVLALLIFAYAQTEIRTGSDNRLTVSFYSLLVYGVPTLLTGLALLYSFVGYFYPFNLDNVRVSPSSFSVIVPQLEKLATAKFPYYHAGMSIDEFFTASAQESVKIQFKSVPKQAEALIASEAIRQRDTLSKRFDVALSGKETLGELLPIATNSYLKRYLGSYKDLVPLLVAISVFLTIKSFGFILDRLAVLIAWLSAKVL